MLYDGEMSSKFNLNCVIYLTKARGFLNNKEQASSSVNSWKLGMDYLFAELEWLDFGLKLLSKLPFNLTVFNSIYCFSFKLGEFKEV